MDISIYVVFLLICLSGVHGQQQVVSEECLGCLCQAVTGCNQKRTCANGDCGMFAITRYFWLDARMPTIEGDSPQGKRAYENCVMNMECATTTIQNYMTRYQKDCNGDGVIDCLDHAAIHMNGPGGCSNPLKANFTQSMQKCLQNSASGKDSDISPIDWRMPDNK